MDRRGFVFGCGAFIVSLVSFIMFVRPLEFVDVEIYVLFFIAFLIPAVGFTLLFRKKGWIAPFIAIPFYGLGMFFLYQGFYDKGSSVLDYFLYREFMYIVEEDGVEFYRKPISYYYLESFLLYCFFFIMGIAIAWFIPKKRLRI